MIICQLIVHLLVNVQNNKRCTLKVLKLKKIYITSSVYDCTVEDVEYSSHLVVVITLP